MTPQEVFEEKAPRVTKLVKFFMSRKGVPFFRYEEILQESFFLLWKKCLKHGPEKISSSLVAKHSVWTVVVRKRKWHRETTFSDWIGDSGPSDNFIPHTKPRDGMTLHEMAMDLIDIYSKDGLSIDEVARRLDTDVKSIRQVRSKLGVPATHPYKDSLLQLSKQLESPIRHFVKPTKVVKLACQDCGRVKDFYPSNLKELSCSPSEYRCRICMPKHVMKKRKTCDICHGFVAKNGRCAKCEKEKEFVNVGQNMQDSQRDYDD